MKNLKKIIFAFSLALWFGVVGGVFAFEINDSEYVDLTDEVDIGKYSAILTNGCPTDVSGLPKGISHGQIGDFCYVEGYGNIGKFKYNLKEIKHRFPDKTDEILDGSFHIPMKDLSHLKCEGFNHLFAGSFVKEGNFCYLYRWNIGHFKYNLDKIEESYVDLTDELSVSGPFFQMQSTCIPRTVSPGNGTHLGQIGDFCYIVGFIKESSNNGKFKYNMVNIRHRFSDKTEEMRNGKYLKYKQAVLAGCVNELSREEGGKDFLHRDIVNRFDLSQDEEFCYVYDYNEGGLKFKKGEISNMNVIGHYWFQKYNFLNSSKLNFTNNSANFGLKPNVEVEYDYDNQDPSVEGISSPIHEEVNKNQVCQLNYELLGDWQFAGGEMNTPAYVWVDSKEEFLKERDDFSSYFRAHYYKYKYICQKQGDLEIEAPSYVDYQIFNENKNKSWINLSSSLKENKSSSITLKQKSKCQMFVLFAGYEKREDDLYWNIQEGDFKGIGYGFALSFDDEEIIFHTTFGPYRRNSNDDIVIIDLGSNKYAFLLKGDFHTRTFTNKIQLNISQLNGCKPVETIEKPEGMDQEPPKQEHQDIETNPNTAESEYNQSTPQIKFHYNKLQNNNNIFTIEEFNSKDKLISVSDNKELKLFKYHWSTDPNFKLDCNDNLKGNEVALISNSTTANTKADINKPKTKGKHYLYVCVKDNENNINTASALYQIEETKSLNNNTNINTQKYPTCLNQKVGWCDSENGPTLNSINPCCLGDNLLECKRQGESYEIVTDYGSGDCR